MPLSRVIASLTRREADSAPAAHIGTRPPSSTRVAPLCESSSLQFVPAKEGEPSLGVTREVRERIADILPGVVFDQDGHGAFIRTGYSVSFETGQDDNVSVVRVQVTGGAAAMPSLQRLSAKTGWRLMEDETREHVS